MPLSQSRPCRRLQSVYLLALMLATVPAALAQSTQSSKLPCDALGNRYARCELAAAAKVPCSGASSVVPERCRNSPEYVRGVFEGTSQFKEAIEERSAELRKIASSMQSSSSPVKQPPPKQIRRRLTGEECARMEREFPAAAEALGMRRKDLTQLFEEAKSNAFPEAARAMISWLGTYNNESLIRYHYEMAGTFGEKCRAGSIRVRE